LESGYPREVKSAMAGRAAISLEPTPGGGPSVRVESTVRPQQTAISSNSQALRSASTRVRRLCIDRHGREAVRIVGAYVVQYKADCPIHGEPGQILFADRRAEP